MDVQVRYAGDQDRSEGTRVDGGSTTLARRFWARTIDFPMIS